jgi:endonuclease/exonuclease/phosphatase family metal-dependent hydrolase
MTARAHAATASEPVGTAAMSPTLHIATYNIHKGFSQFNRRMVVHDLRERLRALQPDIVFLQEVQGLHLLHAERHDDWPATPQHEFLAEDIWHATAYGRNAIYDHGHHGNAILSRFPIASSHNQDVTQLRFERRGMLHCAIGVPGLPQPLHCVCVHLSLFAHSRRRQLDALATRIEALVPADAPLVIAGDFNDWRVRAHSVLKRCAGLREVFVHANGRAAKTFPARFPMLRLDRIYVRNAGVHKPVVLPHKPWSHLSDHAPLAAEITL